MNSSTEAGVKLLKLLGKHAYAIVKAYESQNCYLAQDEESLKAVSDIIKFDLVTQDDNSALYRLHSNIRALLDQGLKTTRLNMVNTDVGSAIEGIRFIMRSYNEAKYANRIYDMGSLISSLDANVSDLCDSLTSQSRNIWRQIDNDFGSVTSLSGKMQLNNNALDKIKLILSSLDHIDLQELMSSSNRDAELRRIINVKLSHSLDVVRHDLNVSLQRLNKTLFKLKRLQERAKLVNNWVHHFSHNPGYVVPDLTSFIDVYPLFRRISPLEMLHTVDVKNPNNEDFLADLIKDIRKTPPPDENLPIIQASVDAQQSEEEELSINPFLIAVRDLYYQCLSNNTPVSAIESYVTHAPEGTEVELWLNGIVAEHNAMTEPARSSFELKYIGEFDSIFTANLIADDIVICPT